MADTSPWGDEHALLSLRRWIVCLCVPLSLGLDLRTFREIAIDLILC